MQGSDDLVVIELEDFTVALVRTAFVPRNAERPQMGAELLDFMLSKTDGQTTRSGGAALLPREQAALPPHVRPIRLDPGLLVYLDRIKRANFLAEWNAAMTQP